MNMEAHLSKCSISACLPACKMLTKKFSGEKVRKLENKNIKSESENKKRKSEYEHEIARQKQRIHRLELRVKT